MLEIDLDAPENQGGSWLQRPKRETAKHPPKDQPSEVPGEELSDTPDKKPENAQSIVQTAKAWDESKHPRNPAGTGAGGEFAGDAGDDACGAYEDTLGTCDKKTHHQGAHRYKPSTPEQARAKTEVPKFVKSKHPQNEYGYTLTHNGRAYEVYRDASMMGGTWLSLDLINKHRWDSPGVPIDHIGHNKADVVNAITSGRLGKLIDQVQRDEHAKKVIAEAGGRYHGPQEDGKGGHLALVTEPNSGSTGVLPFDKLTPEDIKAKLAAIRAQTRKSETEDLAKAIADGLAPTLAAILKGQEQIVEELNADVEQIPVRDETTKRIEKVIRRKVKAGVQPIPETKLPKGTGPTVAS